MQTVSKGGEEAVTIARVYAKDLPEINILKQKRGLASQQEVIRHLLRSYSKRVKA